MAAYMIRRILAIIPLLWAVATLTFILMHAVPGGPFDVTGRPLPDETIETLEDRYGLNGTIWDQYLTFMNNLLHGDLGHSFAQNRPVTEVLAERWQPTVELGLTSFGFAIVVGLTMGTLAAVRQNSWIDYSSVGLTTLGVAVPSFVMAGFLIVIFAVNLGWFDVLGWEFGNYRKMVLPVVALGLLPASFIARITRASLLEVLRQDYIRTARAKGLIEFKIIGRHVMKNGMIPVLTVVGPILAGLITGSFIIEQSFAIPGIGTLFVTSVTRRDYGVIMGTTLLYAFAIAVINLIVDLMYGFVDPRIRY